MNASDTDSRSKGTDDFDAPLDFIRQIVAEDVKAGKNDGRVHTRFPPEPNAYAHIGHAGAAYLNYSIAQDFGGLFNLRFDDTNPLTEEQEYVDAIIEDLGWVGIDWGDRLYFASDYFEQMHEYAVQLVNADKAYVDDLSADEIREYRGTICSTIVRGDSSVCDLNPISSPPRHTQNRSA